MINTIMPRFLKLAYRKEPVSSFILIIGAVDAVMGGVGQRWTLLSLGMLIILIAAAVRWLQAQQTQVVIPEKINRKMLPPSSTNSPLPVLNSRQKHH